MSMTGRPRKSNVWNYFVYQKDINKSVCQVKIVKNPENSSESSICGTQMTGMFASNLKNHLKRQHKEEYQKFEEEERNRTGIKRKRAETGASSSQQTLTEAFKQDLYPENSRRQLAITRKLALFIGATNVPLSLVDCPEFRDLLKEMDKHYRIPYRKKLGQQIGNVYEDLRKKISKVLTASRKLNICCDIWTKQGMTASFLGVTVHLFLPDDNQRHSITLAVKVFEQPHTGERIATLLLSILDEWEIPYWKVFRSLSDNRSNIVKAFHILQDQTNSGNDDDSIQQNHDESAIELIESGDQLLSGGEFSDEDSNTISDDVSLLSYSSDEIRQFEDYESDHNRALISNGFRRCSCFTHTLQLVVKEFEKAPCFKKTVQTTYKIVQKFNKSCKATEKLVALAGKKLVANCPTRWDSMFLMVSRFVALREHVTTVLNELGWDSLSLSQWKQLQSILHLLQPFAHQTNLLSSEHTSSIAMVIPSLMELDLHLNEVGVYYNIIIMPYNLHCLFFQYF